MTEEEKKQGNEADKGQKKRVQGTDEGESLLKKKFSRRDMLKLSALTGAGIAVATSGVASTLDLIQHFSQESTEEKENNQIISMFGKHQPGIITEQQTYCYLVAFELLTDDKAELVSLLQDWTLFALKATKGIQVKDSSNDLLPPNDTGDSIGLGAQKLTLTIGYGATLFEKNGVDRFGIKNRKPLFLKDIPKFAHDSLEDDYSDGDILFQSCSNDRQVAFHAIRNLIRIGSGKVQVKFLEDGFIKGAKKETPRNLFGFKDGTCNADHDSQKGYKEVVWAENDEPTWFQGGSYLGYRKIQMFLEVWDRSSLYDQENTFGRNKMSGAAFGRKKEFDEVILSKQPKDSHVYLAKKTEQQIHRRAYSYQNGIQSKTGNIDAGLLFISFMKDPFKQYVPMLKIMGEKDALNEYTKPIGNGLYACQKGLSKGEYFGQQLFQA
ncbi:iron uptake transporter deferrochelatase/peroxidase subunit [Enterococcus camelliae]|uniref:Deferrochelatase n=1 Tax=Enterococcus camelliae TaxID=453959 RepID=A0ABW5TJV7_9ENTE